ncbi:hypothetical protein [Streptomyces albipurpureus]|uniref:Uncharacterized protein n=1 Tax=Streptomyces albipurpureus TaxID=2897419 RepID=A0ABT0UJI1_9ACTN|nr:hypothetical protein [Streptomyces sp. CWNU-1]MCM2388804.1 hypothetical protein [Streptomyces sp. CWNU-1]
MAQDWMDERSIEQLNPSWIGLAIELETGDGTVVGFRLARYERVARDGEQLWILFSADQPWRTEVSAGTKVRWVRQPAYPGALPGQHPHQTAAAVATPAQLSPQSWVTPPTVGGPR